MRPRIDGVRQSVAHSSSLVCGFGGFENVLRDAGIRAIRLPTL